MSEVPIIQKVAYENNLIKIILLYESINQEIIIKGTKEEVLKQLKELGAII